MLMCFFFLPHWYIWMLDILFSHLSTFFKDSAASVYGLVLPQANTHAQVYRMFQIIVENRPFILGTLVLVVFSALVFHILYPLVRVDSFAFYSYTFPQKISEIRFDTTTHKKSVERVVFLIWSHRNLYRKCIVLIVMW